MALVKFLVGHRDGALFVRTLDRQALKVRHHQVPKWLDLVLLLLVAKAWKLMLNSVGSGRPFLVTRVTADACAQSATLVHGVGTD